MTIFKTLAPGEQHECGRVIYRAAALTPTQAAADDLLAELKAAREELVVAIAFLGRDQHSPERLKVTIPQLINRMVQVEQSAQTAIVKLEPKPEPAHDGDAHGGTFITREFIFIAASIIGNPTDGYRTSYASDLVRFADRQAAIDHGFTKDRSDDFNIGVIENGKLVSVDWMKEPVDTDPALMAEIAKEIGL